MRNDRVFTVCEIKYLRSSLCSQPDKSGREYLFSSGPWWVDGNHAHPGYGYLSLVFLCLLRPDKLRGNFDPALCFPTMREMKIRGQLRGHGVALKGADFLFWFQCYSEQSKKHINYALTAQPLNEALEIEYYSHYEIIEVPPTPEVKAYFAQQRN